MKFFVVITGLFFSCSLFAEPRIDIGRFSQNDVHGWQQKVFDGKTIYKPGLVDGEKVLIAQSENSASAFYREQKVDLNQTPVLNWSWRAEKRIDPGNENQKSGDDFVARIYVVKKGLFFWNTRAINYVWSHQHKKREIWDNPFVGEHSKMKSQRDAEDKSQQWYYEKRNVLEDFKNLYGKEIESIDGVAIMTDSDNSDQAAIAIYGDIYFTAK